ncbi:MAG: LysR substrate-binding domain-containing protein [Victivallaceae bacterium]|nr:LysR substrate-binding domain-containing protein [Victivallaceae bacterium]
MNLFLLLSETLHFSRTAEELGIAQSALSHQIKLLEHECGCSLFERSNRWKVALTPAGQELVHHAKMLVAAEDNALLRVRAAARGECGKLDLAFNPSASNLTVLLNTIRLIRRNYPDIALHIHEKPSSAVYESVKNGEADIGFLRFHAASDENFQIREIARERLAVVLDRTHPFASCKTLTLKDLRNATFLLPNGKDSPLLRETADALCRKAGFELKLFQEIDNFHTILRLLSSFDAVSIIPVTYQKDYPGFVFRIIDDADAVLPEAMMWKKDNPSAVLQTFLDAFRRTAKA